MKFSQSYYCGKCNKFVLTYTTHMKPQYDGVFWGYPVKQREALLYSWWVDFAGKATAC